ncbi:2-amino-4-hydroxy-6-hydroxymethyldihydropteridine diphosphokinase [Cloacibacterium normanense]|uniref:2-amino-4-hydroxy-6- hydroxymethyldihydropteridine diphosphokinase n=1 Tax=Cloacibacterium normanense TaxID=237258 RepID=UPI00352C94A8
MSLHYVVLLLGSNLGDTELHLNNAIAKIENRLGKVIKTSEMIETQPIEFESTNIFCNIAIGLTTTISPYSFLNAVKSIEKEMGRELDSSAVGGYIDRIIDIDIVIFNNINFESKKLKIPHHKHLCEREFSKALLDSLNIK